MASKKRRGMIIKNVSERPLQIRMMERTISMKAGEEVPISAEEVQDPALRERLQIRAIAIVRPLTREEQSDLFEGGGPLAPEEDLADEAFEEDEEEV